MVVLLGTIHWLQQPRLAAQSMSVCSSRPLSASDLTRARVSHKVVLSNSLHADPNLAPSYAVMVNSTHLPLAFLLVTPERGGYLNFIIVLSCLAVILCPTLIFACTHA